LYVTDVDDDVLGPELFDTQGEYNPIYHQKNQEPT